MFCSTLIQGPTRRVIVRACLVVAGALLSPSTAAAADSGISRPIEATESGLSVVNIGDFSSVQDVTGTESHLGKVTAHYVGTLSGTVNGFTITGSTTTVAANGDELLGTFTATGTSDIAAGTSQGQIAIIITGGTGRFMGATGTQTGSFTVRGTSTNGSIFTGVATFSLKGIISY